MQVRLQPRDRLVIRPQVKVRPAARLPKRPTAQQVVSEHAQRMHHSQQLEDVCIDLFRFAAGKEASPWRMT
jgi:hypothetical protein